MNATTIDRLAAADPSGPYKTASEAFHTLDVDHPSITKFAHRYANPAFGWYIAGKFAAANKPIPTTLCRHDTWVFKAWLMRRSPARFYDRFIAEAFALARLPALRSVGELVRAAILSSCINPDDRCNQERSVSENTGISPWTIQAFEALFYNVYDRAKDHAYLANVLYPETRLVEFHEDYFKNVDVSDLLKRASYNHKELHMTLYLAGVGDATYLSKLAERPDREMLLAKQIIGNALLLSYSGMLNQRSIGMSRGQSLMVATRQSGTQEQDNPLTAVGGLLMDQLAQLSDTNYTNMSSMLRNDAGMGDVIEI